MFLIIKHVDLSLQKGTGKYRVSFSMY